MSTLKTLTVSMIILSSVAFAATSSVWWHTLGYIMGNAVMIGGILWDDMKKWLQKN